MCEQKNKRLNVRISESDYTYFMYLKEKGISISKHVLLSVKTSPAYKSYYKHLNG